MFKLTMKQITDINGKIAVLNKDFSFLYDENLLYSIMSTVYKLNEQGFYVYKNIHEQTAKMMELISLQKPFYKFNIKTGVVAMLTTFSLNDINLIYTKEELIELIDGISKQELTYEELLEWTLKHREHDAMFKGENPYLAHRKIK